MDDEFGEDRGFLAFAQHGESVEIYGRLPAVIRLHDWAVVCATAIVSADGTHLTGHGGHFDRDLQTDGWQLVDTFSIDGDVHQDGGILRNSGIADFTGYGTTMNMHELHPTTKARSGGKRWNRIERGCRTHGW